MNEREGEGKGEGVEKQKWTSDERNNNGVTGRSRRKKEGRNGERDRSNQVE